MVDAWHEDPPARHPPGSREHPVIGWIGVVAILAASVAIAWVGLEIHGTRHFEAVLTDAPDRGSPAKSAGNADRRREIDEAVTTSRWATGLSP